MNALLTSSAPVTDPAGTDHHAACTPTDATQTPANTVPCLRVLYVEDDPSIRRAVQLLLARLGHRVAVAADGAEGWSSLQAGNHDLLITDHQMPGLTGLELIRKVRLAGMTMPIIVASGSLDELPIDELLWLECGPLLAKPFTAGQLLSAVDAVARSAGIAAASPGCQPPVAESVSSGFSDARHWGINEWLKLRRIDYGQDDSPLQRFVTVGN